MRGSLSVGLYLGLLCMAARVLAQDADAAREKEAEAEVRQRVEGESVAGQSRETRQEVLDRAVRRGVDWLARAQCVNCHFQVPQQAAALDTKGTKHYTAVRGEYLNLQANQALDKSVAHRLLCSRDAERKEIVTYLGVSLAAVPAVVRRHVAIPAEMGLLVETVDVGSPAQSAGVKQHDVLVKIDEQFLVNPEQFSVLVRTLQPNSEVKLLAIQQSEPKVLRARLAQRETALASQALTTLALVNADRATERQQLAQVHGYRFLTATQAPADAEHPPVARRKKAIAFLGVQTTTPSEALAKQLKLTPGTGLMVESVEADSAAFKGGLKAFDVLQKFDDQVLVNGEQFTVLIRSRKPGDEIRLALIREGKREVLPITLGQREIEVVSEETLDEFESRLSRTRSDSMWTWTQPHGVWTGLSAARTVVDATPDAVFLRRVYLDILGVVPPAEEVKAFAQDSRPDKRQRLVDGLLARPEAISRASGATALKWSDSEHDLTLITKAGRRHLSVLDAQGKKVFEGPVGTEEEQKVLPRDVAQKLAYTIRLEEGRETPANGAQEALDRMLPKVELSEVSLKRAFEQLRELSGANLVVNWKALKVAGVDAEEPVSLSLTDVRLSTALNTLLSLAGDEKVRLAFLVEGEVILVSVR